MHSRSPLFSPRTTFLPVNMVSRTQCLSPSNRKLSRPHPCPASRTQTQMTHGFARPPSVFHYASVREYRSRDYSVPHLRGSGPASMTANGETTGNLRTYIYSRGWPMFGRELLPLSLAMVRESLGSEPRSNGGILHANAAIGDRACIPQHNWGRTEIWMWIHE